MSLAKYYPELASIDVHDPNVKIPIRLLKAEDQILLGKALAEYTVDNMDTSVDRESVNYTYQYYFNIASLPNTVIVEALLAIKKED